MPNHIHMVFSVGRAGCPSYKADVGRADCSPYRVTKIIKNLKWYTALESNKVLNRSGPFWQHESYDHVVRDNSDLERIVDYVIMNPVYAGLVDSCEKWAWTYLKEM